MKRLPLALALALACTPTAGPPERLTIPRGASFREATDTLVARGLVRWRPWFTLVARIGGQDRSIKPGVYELMPGTSAGELLRILSTGEFVTVKVTIPEGFTMLDIAARLEGTLGLSRDSVLALARDPALRERFGVEAPTLEGYLGADTYTLPANATAREAVVAMATQFASLWTDDLAAQARAQGLSRHAVVTLASIVEGEASVDDERPVIAAVYRNRLRIGMPLQADPTVQYAIQQAMGRRKPRLLFADYEFASPYNTYLIPGLPPGPIGAPSQASLQAVLAPAEVPYLYFVGDGTGRHIFTRTHAEHVRATTRVRAR